MDRLAVLKKLANDVDEGKLCFPTNVAVALKLRNALDDPDESIDSVARLIEKEPLLAARVVAMSNAVAFNRSGREIADVRTAVSRLGTQVVRNLATALVTRQMALAPPGAAERALAARLWEYTAHVAALARMIARQVTRQDPETAMFAAIVHDIGGFYLLSHAGEFPDLLNEGLTDDDVEGELLLARAVLKVLAVPSPVVQAIESFWEGYLALPPVSLGDTLLLAADLAPVQRPLNRLARRGRKADDGSIDMVVGEATLQEITQAAKAEVQSLLEVLRF